MSNLRVLVVGASIAGPTAAYWLAKAGATITVIERFPALRLGGQSVDIRTAGVAVMRKMPGMEEAVRAKNTTLEGISFVSSNGQSYGTIKPTGDPDQQSLVSEYEIFRGDLGQILYDLTKDNENIKYVFGEQVASMQHTTEQDGPVTVEFMNGYPTTEYDLVVACDGATSRTRAIGLGAGVRDHIRPANSWSAYWSMKGDLLNGKKIGQAYTAVGGRFLAIGPDPSGITRVIVMAHHPRSNYDALVPFRQAMKQGDDALKQYVFEHFKDAGWKAQEVLKGMMQANDFNASENVQVTVPHLSRGRFVMVGDAGYAAGLTGGGTTLALTGAYLLAGEISKNKGNLAAALAGYEKEIKPFIKELGKAPPFLSSIMAPQTAWGIWLRNMIFAFIAWSRIIDFVQKFSGGAFSSSEKFRLPEYEWVA
ncbi:uncharacterized protein N7459_001491 [Penicillium hispanicum]|uniref:uncharacterized protein n=1 Tax=Penicillium hispanicum TaxID=1080232 RepID=UPI002540977E|nr:uncharacterized protein N7459_001491 [Penicillium hispanicum]KAJ5595283.1 hypothetical protein N7459_001491 [Penicillium hispanicum]